MDKPGFFTAIKSRLYEPQLCYFSPDVLWYILVYFVHLTVVKQTIEADATCTS